MENTTVLEEATHNAAHANAVTNPAYAGTQSTHATDDQVNVHACLRGTVQGHDDVLVEQGVHLCDDVSWAAVTRVLSLTSDQPQTAFRQIERRDQKRFVLGMLGISRQEVEHVVHRGGNFRVGGEQAQVGVDARGTGVIVPGSEVGIAASYAIKIPAD